VITLVACFEVSRPQTDRHTHTHTWQESSERILSPLQKPLPTQHTTNTKLDTHDFSGFWTRDRNNQAASNLRRRPHGHGNGHILINGGKFRQEYRCPSKLLLYCEDAGTIARCYYVGGGRGGGDITLVQHSSILLQATLTSTSNYVCRYCQWIQALNKPATSKGILFMHNNTN
jgi:hypothetical protein